MRLCANPRTQTKVNRRSLIRIGVVLVILTSVLLGILIPSASGAPLFNLVGNPGFEEPGAGGADVWAGWVETAGGGTIADTTTGSEVHGDVHAAKLTYVSGTAPKIEYSVNVTAGQYMWLSFWVRGDGTHVMLYSITDATHAAQIIPLVSTSVSSTIYNQKVVGFQVPAGCTVVTILFQPQSVAGTEYVDDLDLYVAAMTPTPTSATTPTFTPTPTATPTPLYSYDVDMGNGHGLVLRQQTYGEDKIFWAVVIVGLLQLLSFINHLAERWLLL